VPVRVTGFEDPAESRSVPVDSGSAPGNSLPSAAVVAPGPHAEKASERFQWKPAFAQYPLEIAIQHGWRFAHEPGTRDATGNGPFFKDWIDSIARPGVVTTATAGLPASLATH